MNQKEEEFLKRLQAIFKVEAEEHISVLSSGLIELEKDSKSEKSDILIESVFREAHSLKGAARSVNRTDIESICQVLESIFSLLKNGKLSISSSHFDLIHQALDGISAMISETNSEASTDHRKIINQLEIILIPSQSDNAIKKTPNTEPPVLEKKRIVIRNTEPGKAETNIQKEKNLSKMVHEPVDEVQEKSEHNTQKTTQQDTLRIQAQKLDTLFLQSEQLIQTKITHAQRNMELQEIYEFVKSWKAAFRNWDASFASGSGMERQKMMDYNRENVNQLEAKLANISFFRDADQRMLGRLVDEHVDSMKNLLMLPISTIVEGFHKIVRDLARDQGKDVELNITGKEIEVDKRILEELKDPLIHMIRNCVDHGIKTPEARSKINKPEKAIIYLDFKSLDGRKIEISISDDGAGINIEKVIDQAIKMGLIAKGDESKMSDHEITHLIFKSGFSTSAMITDLSGRGLGLAIVKEKVEKLGGSINVETKAGIGTTFKLILPQNLSTYRGVLVRIGDFLGFLPTRSVGRTIRVHPKEIKTVENKETIILNDQIISLTKLSSVLGIVSRNQNSLKNNGNSNVENYLPVVILTMGNKQIGFVVDEILEEQEILVKELGKQLKNVRNISGASVLGTGKVVPVLNASDLMKYAFKERATVINSEVEQEPQTAYKILVTDDSITSRTLIKDILENAGYVVETAYDGMDGFTKAVIGDFDLIVSDVDMPRMNGFEFTTKVRNDKKISELPVVLVTALESREDREHGINVGANAYIIKSSFDQSNLLEVVQKLL